MSRRAEKSADNNVRQDEGMAVVLAQWRWWGSGSDDYIPEAVTEAVACVYMAEEGCGRAPVSFVSPDKYYDFPVVEYR